LLGWTVSDNPGVGLVRAFHDSIEVESERARQMESERELEREKERD